jgi:glycosyltransferase involved in cell wall biosynthesis
VTSEPETPGVSVVIATRGRPELLRRAVRSIFAQDGIGSIEIVVVYDGIEIDPLSDAAVPPRHTLRTVANTRTPGLAGGRNTGISIASHDLIAFCDDDDEWMPAKLRSQMALLAEEPRPALVATGIRIESAGGSHERLPPDTVDFADLLESRITEIHPSSFLLRREDLLGSMGLVDEQLPASYGEDYDLLLRAARLGPIRSVTEPLTVVHWNRSSFFSERWEGIAAGLSYLLEKFPEFASTPKGAARIEGQIAFAYAALGDRERARDWARRTLRHDRRQLRAYAALAVARGLVSPTTLVRMMNRRGRGL